VALGFEQERRGDDVLVALLDGATWCQGGIALPDKDRLVQELINRDPRNTDLGNPPQTRAWMNGLAEASIALLISRIKEWQQATTSGTVAEYYSRVERALLILDAGEAAVYRSGVNQEAGLS
jgi:hypothetical protein